MTEDLHPCPLLESRRQYDVIYPVAPIELFLGVCKGLFAPVIVCGKQLGHWAQAVNHQRGYAKHSQHTWHQADQCGHRCHTVMGQCTTAHIQTSRGQFQSTSWLQTNLICSPLEFRVTHTKEQRAKRTRSQHASEWKRSLTNSARFLDLKMLISSWTLVFKHK